MWNKNCDLAKEYIKENNTTKIPRNLVYKKVNLGTWLSRQKVLYNKNKLPKDKVGKLQSLGIRI